MKSVRKGGAMKKAQTCAREEVPGATQGIPHLFASRSKAREFRELRPVRGPKAKSQKVTTDSNFRSSSCRCRFVKAVKNRL